jgi:hypothetical protein
MAVSVNLQNEANGPDGRQQSSVRSEFSGLGNVNPFNVRSLSGIALKAGSGDPETALSRVRFNEVWIG